MKLDMILIILLVSVGAGAATSNPPGTKKARVPVQKTVAPPATLAAVSAPPSASAKYEVCQAALDKILGRGADAGKCSYSISIRMKNGDQNFVTVEDSVMYGEPDSKEDQNKITLTRKEGGSYIKVALEYDGSGRLTTVRCGSHGGDLKSINLDTPEAKRLDLMYEPGSGKCGVVDDSASGTSGASPARSHGGTLAH